MLSRHAPFSRHRVDGILLLDKPQGPSSNEALQRVKRLLCARKAGHAGTLDPLATGLLPLLFGEATKFASYLSGAHKAYEATMLLGVSTSTGDLAGEVTERRPVQISASQLESIVRGFLGEIQQVPPMYSALKRAGTPLYELARRGEVVPRLPRSVRIEELLVRGIDEDEVDVFVRCSKGTYIRVLAEDIGRALGCGATLKRLRRTAVGGFDVRRAATLDELEALSEPERLRRLLPSDASLKHLPSVRLSRDEARLVQAGQRPSLSIASRAEGIARLYDDETGTFLGLGEIVAGLVRPIRLIRNAGLEMS